MNGWRNSKNSKTNNPPTFPNYRQVVTHIRGHELLLLYQLEVDNYVPHWNRNRCHIFVEVSVLLLNHYQEHLNEKSHEKGHAQRQQPCLHVGFVLSRVFRQNSAIRMFPAHLESTQATSPPVILTDMARLHAAAHHETA
jgi:hypothetical protein